MEFNSKTKLESENPAFICRNSSRANGLLKGGLKTSESGQMKAFIDTICRNVFVGMATAVVRKDYDKFVTGRLREKLGNYHYTFAVQSCLVFIEEWRRHSYVSEPMHYVFDLVSEGKHEIIDLFDDIAKRETAIGFGIELDGYAFQSRRRVVQLQAADILAWEAYKYARDNQSTSLPPRRSFRSMVEGIDIRTRFFDASGLPDFVHNMTARYEEHGWNDPLVPLRSFKMPATAPCTNQECGCCMLPAAIPNSSAMKCACPIASPSANHRTLPLLIMCIASIPCKVRQALWNEPYPLASQTRFFTVR